MFYHFMFVFAICVSSAAFSQNNSQISGHTLSGTEYSSQSNNAYAKVRHGPDGKLFLDPYFLPFIENLKQERVLDVGCGSGPWAIYAAEHGGLVSCIDIQQEMINQAIEAAKLAGIEDKIDFSVGDAAFLPYKNSFFQRALSINVGCNLPSTITVRQSDGTLKKVGLGPHFSELSRVLEPKGKLILTAPASFDVVFTSTDRNSIEILQSINRVLGEIKNVDDSNEIVTALNTLTEINRATFVVRNNQLKLVTSINELTPGENIWRKLPGLTVPNRYHSEEEYLHEANQAGFKIVQIYREKFKDETARLQYNTKHDSSMQLGNTYTTNHPFTVIEFEKI